MSSRDDLRAFDDAYASASGDDPFKSIPDGQYQVMVDRVEIGTTKNGNPKLAWELTVIGPTHENRKLFKNSVITNNPKTMEFLKRDLKNCGIDIERLSDLPDHLEKLLDLRLRVHKKTSGDFENIYIGGIVSEGGSVDPGDPFPGEKLPF
jgi:hypothetical protein